MDNKYQSQHHATYPNGSITDLFCSSFISFQRTCSRGKKYLYFIAAVLAIMVIHKHRSSAPSEDSSPNLRAGDANKAENSGKNKDEESKEKPATLKEKMENFNKFEKEFEKDEQDREHLDETIKEVKKDIEHAEQQFVKQDLKKLENLVNDKKELAEAQLLEYLRINEGAMSSEEYVAIMAKLNEAVDEELKNDLLIKAEQIEEDKEDEVEE